MENYFPSFILIINMLKIHRIHLYNYIFIALNKYLNKPLKIRDLISEINSKYNLNVNKLTLFSYIINLKRLKYLTIIDKNGQLINSEYFGINDFVCLFEIIPYSLNTSHFNTPKTDDSINKLKETLKIQDRTIKIKDLDIILEYTEHIEKLESYVNLFDNKKIKEEYIKSLNFFKVALNT